MQQGARTLRLAVLMSLLAVGYLGYRVHRLERLVAPIDAGAPVRPPIAPRGDLTELERATVELFRAASVSVVHITTLDVKAIQADLFRSTVLEIPKGTGSGFVWDASGHIVTNLHVLQSASKARVTLPDHSVWPAQLVGFSRRYDLAVLKVPGAAPRARPLPVGTSHDLLVGQGVIAIGSPFGLDYTLSTGVISGVGRELPAQSGTVMRGMIQTDAAINPGNSGGPLLDSAGRLIGVNTAILSPSGASAGVGFAVPVDAVARIVPELIRYGREVRPVIGVELAHDEVVRRLGLRGALVLSVTPGSPAEQAGIMPTARDRSGRIVLGDLIVRIDDTSVEWSEDLYGALDQRRPGDRATLTLRRDGDERQVEVTLGTNVPLND